LKKHLKKHLAELKELTTEERNKNRIAKYSAMGEYIEG
jgi:acetyl-CoA carboxylase alpha subunit